MHSRHEVYLMPYQLNLVSTLFLQTETLVLHHTLDDLKNQPLRAPTHRLPPSKHGYSPHQMERSLA